MREIMETPSYRHGQTKLPRKIGKIFASSASYKIAPSLTEITKLLSHTIKSTNGLAGKPYKPQKLARIVSKTHGSLEPEKAAHPEN
jgi:hypothetical protein